MAGVEAHHSLDGVGTRGDLARVHPRKRRSLARARFELGAYEGVTRKLRRLPGLRAISSPRMGRLVGTKNNTMPA